MMILLKNRWYGKEGVDPSIIWEIIAKNLPETKPLIVEMYNNLD